MTKCEAYWRIIGEFREGKRFVEIDNKKLTGFEGFRAWCGKGYMQARRDWNTYETLLLFSKKLNIPPCEVLTSVKLTEKGLMPLVNIRKYVGKHKTLPDDIQNKIIDALIPKLLTRRLKPGEIRAIVRQYLPARRHYKPRKVVIKEVNFDRVESLNILLQMLGLLKQLKLPESYAHYIKQIKSSIDKLLDVLEKKKWKNAKSVN